MGDGAVAPVAAGLAVGIAFVVLFSILATPEEPVKSKHIEIAVDGLKDTYKAGEPMSFTVNTEGFSDNLCNYPKLHVVIVRADDQKIAWSTPPTFQTVMGCNELKGIDEDWRFGYENEELPYQSAIPHDANLENKIVMEQAGLYKIRMEFDGHEIEKEFSVAG